MEQTNKPWVVNREEAINRTCSRIYEEHKLIIEDFNKKIINKCNECKHKIVYKTDNSIIAKDLHYFYLYLGYRVEVEELPQYKDGIEYTIFKLKLYW